MHVVLYPISTNQFCLEQIQQDGVIVLLYVLYFILRALQQFANNWSFFIH